MDTPVSAIGERLRRLRSGRGLSLEEAARLTGVSKPMLGQIERGRSVPTVKTLWKIAAGLKAPLSAFLEAPQGDYSVAGPPEGGAVLSDHGRMRAYPLFAYDPLRSLEVFYIEFAPGCRHASAPHDEGVEEYVFVCGGALQLVFNGEAVTVGERQAVRFRADVPHAYNNLSQGLCAVYNVIFYPGWK